MTEIIPYQLLQGLHTISDSILQKFPLFYANVLCSYAYTNNLYYQDIDDSSLPQNLWCGKAFAYIDYEWITAGFFTVADLPVLDGKIDVIAVTCKLQSIGCNRSPYLICCAFQAQFARYFTTSVEGTFVPNGLLPLAMKCILQANTSEMLSLTNWCHALEILLLEVPESEQVFQQMLVNCKITKFREVNFKILAHILATPKIVARVHQTDNLSWCAWCGDLGS